MDNPQHDYGETLGLKRLSTLFRKSNRPSSIKSVLKDPLLSSIVKYPPTFSVVLLKQGVTVLKILLLPDVLSTSFVDKTKYKH